MRQTEQVTLGDFTYNVTQLPLREARSLLIKITNVLGPAIGDAVTGDAEGVTVDGGSIGDAVKTLAMNLSDSDFGMVQDTLFKHVTWVNRQGHEIPLSSIVDEHFAGGQGLSRLFKLIFAALGVNYSDFLAGLGLDGLVQSEAVLPVSRPISTGTSGD